ncbi:T9SS type A sorting domain-containing protein [Winogradskyella sp. PC D3.3]
MWSRYPDSNPLPGATSKVLTHQIIFNSTGSGINPSTSFYENSFSEHTKYTSNSDGNWNDVNRWVYKGIPTNGGDITINNNLVLDIDANIDTSTINAGSSLTLNTSTTLTITEDLTLNSDSDLYSSLISDGTIIGNVTYKRYVNPYNSTPGSTTGGNDLISAPVTNASQTFGVFRATNTNIPSGSIGGTTNYLFGPFDNSNLSAPYTLYSASDDSKIITTGTGYRTGSTNASTFTFVGDVSTGTVPVNINTGSAFNWNLIGNPYPSYINSADFLTANAAFLDEDAVGIYGYDGSAQDGWDIINFNTMNTTRNLAPGQGFMVAAESSSTLNFTPTMRRASGGDDFIAGRTSETNSHFSLQLEKTNAKYHTDFYFNTNSTRALDPGYDAKLFNSNVPDFYLYSELVESNEGQKMAIQSLNSSDLSDVTIPLGVYAKQGDAVTFNITTSNLSNTTQVYLEDNATNTFTLLNTDSYTTTLNSNLNGTGRFYLHTSNTTLSTTYNQVNGFNISTNNTNKTIMVSGMLLEKTTAKLYDLQGRLVSATSLKNTNDNWHAIDVSSLITGIYIIELTNSTQHKTQKIIIR